MISVLGGSILNSQRIYHMHPLQINDQIVIGPCLIELKDIQSVRSLLTEIKELNSVEQSLDDKEVNLISVEAEPKRAVTNNFKFEENLVSPRSNLNVRGFSAEVEPTLLIAQRDQLHKLLLDALDLKRNNITVMDDSLLREEASKLLNQIVEGNEQFKSLSYAKELCEMVINEAVGLGPLEDLLNDPELPKSW